MFHTIDTSKCAMLQDIPYSILQLSVSYWNYWHRDDKGFFFFFVICLFFSTTGYNTYNNLLTLHVTIHYLYLQLNYMTYLQYTTGSI